MGTQVEKYNVVEQLSRNEMHFTTVLTRPIFPISPIFVPAYRHYGSSIFWDDSF